MPLFSNPANATGRTKFFQFRKIEGVQEILKQISGGIEQIKTASDRVLGTVNSVNTVALEAKGTVDSVNTVALGAKGTVDSVNTVALGAKGTVDSVNTVALGAKTTLDSVNTAALDIQNQVGNTDHPMEDSLFFKVKQLKILATGNGDISKINPDRADEFWICMRTLNRVESLATDKAFKLEQNNTTLKKYLNDDLVSSCKNALTNDLRVEVENVYQQFPTAHVKDRLNRLNRLAAVQNLRQAIIEYFLSGEQSRNELEAITDQT